MDSWLVQIVVDVSTKFLWWILVVGVDVIIFSWPILSGDSQCVTSLECLSVMKDGVRLEDHFSSPPHVLMPLYFLGAPLRWYAIILCDITSNTQPASHDFLRIIYIIQYFAVFWKLLLYEIMKLQSTQNNILYILLI